MAFFLFLFLPISIFVAFPAFASEGANGPDIDMTGHPGAWFCLIVFALSYIAVLTEEKHRMRKSMPVLLSAGIIWATIALIAPSYGVDHDHIEAGVFHDLDQYASLLLFLLAAMTYISVLQERRVFAALRAKLVGAGLNMRQLFWVTGLIAFFLSSVADNLTTALVMGAVVLAVGANDTKFVGVACVNIVSAANAGGVFSPFGDITSLMVWQSGHLDFFQFFNLFLPAFVCFLVPAFFMSFAVPRSEPSKIDEGVHMKRGARIVIALGVSTIAIAVAFEKLLGIPAFMGMMTGLSLLLIYGYVLQMTDKGGGDKDLDLLETIAEAEWDTLLFFFGVVFSVGGLAYLGWLSLASDAMYGGMGPTWTNIALGISSAVIDNIPVMFAVLSMEPQMNDAQWMLVTLTTGVGGSMLSIGSAAGVALMGLARNQYTFSVHLKWTPFLALGYAAAIGTHLLVNGQ